LWIQGFKFLEYISRGDCQIIELSKVPDDSVMDGTHNENEQPSKPLQNEASSQWSDGHGNLVSDEPLQEEQFQSNEGQDQWDEGEFKIKGKRDLHFGAEFNDISELKAALEQYCNASNAILSIRDSFKMKRDDLDKDKYPYQKLRYRCTHGMEKRKRGKGMRHNISYNDRKCPFQLNVVFDISEKVYRVSTFHDKHENHEVSQAAKKCHPRSRQLTLDEEKKYQEYLVSLKVPKTIVKQRIAEETGKKLTTQDLANVMRKCKSSGFEENDVEATLRVLKEAHELDSGSTLKITHQKDDGTGYEVLKSIFWQSTAMKESFAKYGSVLFVDGTYSLNNKGYTLITFLVMDNHSKSRIIAWSLVSNEDKETLEEVLVAFKDSNADNIDIFKYIVLDKDLSEINALHNVFPNIEFIICHWHAIKAVERYVSQMKLNADEQFLKQILKNLFHRMVYSFSEADYIKAWQEMQKLANQNEEMDRAVAYFEENWHSHRQHFARYILKRKELFSSYTNNRSEGMNKFFKDLVKKKGKVFDLIEVLLAVDGMQMFQKRMKDYESNNRTYSPNTEGDCFAEEIVDECNKLIPRVKVSEVLKQLNLVNSVKKEHLNLGPGQIKCTKKSEPCSFNVSNLLPCKHIFAVRIHNEEPLIDPAMIGDRWLLDKCKDSQETSKMEKRKIYAKRGASISRSRFNRGKNILKELEQILSQCYPDEFEQNIDQLDQMKTYWNKDIITTLDDGTVKACSSGTEIKSAKVDGNSFIFQPKKVNDQLKTTGQTMPSYGKCNAKKTAKKTAKGEPDLTDWMVESNAKLHSIGAHTSMTKEHFDMLRDDSTEWLTSTHMDYTNALLKKQFPGMQGLNSTLQYQVEGYPQVDPNKDFIQILHGGNHWAIVSNIFVPQENRHNTVILYDSLISFDGKSLNRPKQNNLFNLQIAQLLRNDSSSKSNLYVQVQPCHQQTDGHSCGMFAIANAISLAYGIDPSLVHYDGNMRSQFSDMLRTCNLVCMKHKGKGSGLNFAPVTVGKIRKNVMLQRMVYSFAVICHCKMPESYSPTVQCRKCKKLYHQVCYMINKHNYFAKKVHFLCYPCREPGVYNFQNFSKTTINTDQISAVGDKIGCLPSYKLGAFLPHVISLNADKRVTKTQKEFAQVEDIQAAYDLNELLNKKGKIYASVFNFYEGSKSESQISKAFTSLNIAQLNHFAVLLICNVLNISCEFLLGHEVGSGFPIDIGSDEEGEKKTEKTLKSTLTKKELEDCNSEIKKAKKSLSVISKEICGLFDDKVISKAKMKDEHRFLKRKLLDLEGVHCGLVQYVTGKEAGKPLKETKKLLCEIKVSLTEIDNAIEGNRIDLDTLLGRLDRGNAQCLSTSDSV
jgi:hypothetical protein